MSEKSLTREYLMELLTYDHESGLLYWNRSGSGRKSGAPAGHKTSAGYIRVTVDGERYFAHVLIWRIVKDEWVVRGIDHWDLNKANNKWVNLRKATRAQNTANCRARKNNALGVKGVYKSKCPHRQKKPFCAQINANGKNKWLGDFATAEEAHAAYVAAAGKMFGEFARFA